MKTLLVRLRTWLGISGMTTRVLGLGNGATGLAIAWVLVLCQPTKPVSAEILADPFNAGSSNVKTPLLQVAQFSARDLMRRGNQYAGRGEYQQAITYYNQALELDPRNSEIFYRRGLAWHGSERFYNAVRDFGRALRRDRRNPLIYLARSRSLIELKQYSRVVVDMTTVLEIDPALAEAYYLRGVAEANRGRSDAARFDFREASRLYRQQVNVLGYQEVQRQLQLLR